MKKLLVIALLLTLNCHGMLRKVGMGRAVLMYSNRGTMRDVSGLRFFSSKNTNQDSKKVTDTLTAYDWGAIVDEYVEGMSECARVRRRMQSSHDKNVTSNLLQCQLKKYPDFHIYRLPIADEVLEQYTISKVLTNHSDHFVMALLLPKNNNSGSLPLVLEWSWQAIVDWNNKNQESK